MGAAATAYYAFHSAVLHFFLGLQRFSRRGAPLCGVCVLTLLLVGVGWYRCNGHIKRMHGQEADVGLLPPLDVRLPLPVLFSLFRARALPKATR